MKTSQNLFFLIAIISIIGFFLFFTSFLIEKIFFSNTKIRWKIFIPSFIIVLAFCITLPFGEFIPETISTILYTSGAVLLGAHFITFLSLFSLFIFAKVRNKYFTKNAKIIIAIFCISVNIASLYAGFIPKVQNYSITINKQHSLHGKRIVIISDTHYGYIHKKWEAKFLVKQINELNPDLVLIPGDVFDGPKIDFEEITKVLAQISAPTFYVNGNHEEYRHTQEILDAIAKTDIIILNDETQIFDDFIISGVTYHKNKTETQLAHTLTHIQQNHEHKIKILLKHEPTGHEIIEKFGYDLVVSGHTHRGQMWPFSFIPEKIYGKYHYGLNQDWNLWSLTTSGVGNWWPPQRLWSRSEIIVLEIE